MHACSQHFEQLLVLSFGVTGLCKLVADFEMHGWVSQQEICQIWANRMQQLLVKRG